MGLKRLLNGTPFGPTVAYCVKILSETAVRNDIFPGGCCQLRGMVMNKIKHKGARQLFKAVDIFFVCSFLLLRMVVYVLPASAVYDIASALGYALYYLIPGARERLFNIVSEAMPELTDSKHIKRIGRSSIIELYKPLFDLAVYARHRDRMVRDAVIEGLDNLDQADAFGKGVIIQSAHVGGWALAILAAPPIGVDATLIAVNPDALFTPPFRSSCL